MTTRHRESRLFRCLDHVLVNHAGLEGGELVYPRGWRGRRRWEARPLSLPS